MRHTPNSLATRIARLEERHAPQLALTAKVRMFYADGQRLDDGLAPVRPGAIHAVVNVTIAGQPLDEPDEIKLPPNFVASRALAAVILDDPDPAPAQPASHSELQAFIAPPDVLIIRGSGDALLDVGEALVRAKRRGRGHWGEDD